jgi:preprotein translocase subunit YajC
MSFLIPDAFADGPAAAGGAASAADPLFTLLPLVLFAVVFYFLLIRPQTKRQKEHKRMVDNLARGDEVITLGGLAGRIVDLGENFVVMEIADGVHVKNRRSAIEAVLPKGTLKDL